MAEFDTILGASIVVGVFVGIFFLSGLRIIRPTHRAAVETFGKYSRFQSSGITWIFPGIQKLYKINTTEQLVDVQKQETITADNLNATVDAQVYFKVKDDEFNLKNALYNVNSYETQIVQLARTTLRNVIGTKPFKEVNSNRNVLNNDIFKIIEKETQGWGIEIVRCELKEIRPPEDVQETMNRVLKAENTKDAEKDFAIANETKASGEKLAQIQVAEGEKKAKILKAEGEAEAIIKVAEAKAKEIELVNSAADQYFTGNAQVLEKLQVTRDSLDRNTKYIMTQDGLSPTLVVNETENGIIPIENDERKTTARRKPFKASTSKEVSTHIGKN